MAETSSAADCALTKDTESLRGDMKAVLGQLLSLQVQSMEAQAHFMGTRFTGMQRRLEDVVSTAGAATTALPGELCTTAAVNMISHRITLLVSTIRSLSNQATTTDGPAPSVSPGHDKCKPHKPWPFPLWCFGSNSWPVMQATVPDSGIRLRVDPRLPSRAGHPHDSHR